MKAVILILLAAGIAGAQFEDTEGKLLECKHGCCDRLGGAWNETAGECVAGGAIYNDYYKCRNECLEIASRDYEAAGGGGSLCCAPALILSGLVAVCLHRLK